MQSGNPVGVPSLAVASGATGPAPSEGISIAYSTTLEQLVFWNGTQWLPIATTNTGSVPGADEPFFYRATWWVNDKGSYGNAVATLNTTYAFPIIVSKPITITAFDFYVQAAASGNTGRIGIYGVDSGNLPNNLIQDVGSGSLTTGSVFVTVTPSSPITLAAGVYWLCFTQQGSAAAGTMAGKVNVSEYNLPTSAPLTSPVTGYMMTGVTGALPATFTSAGATSTVLPRIWMKLQ